MFKKIIVFFFFYNFQFFKNSFFSSKIISKIFLNSQKTKELFFDCEEILLEAPLLNLLVMPLSIVLTLTSLSLKNLIFVNTSSGINLNRNPTNKLPAPKAKQIKCWVKLKGEVSVKLPPISTRVIWAIKIMVIMTKNNGLLQKLWNTFRSFLLSFLLLTLLNTCINTKVLKNMVKCWYPVALYEVSFEVSGTLKISGPANKMIIRTVNW